MTLAECGQRWIFSLRGLSRSGRLNNGERPRLPKNASSVILVLRVAAAARWRRGFNAASIFDSRVLYSKGKYKTRREPAAECRLRIAASSWD